MSWKLHRGGRFRGWLGARLGGDFDLGDRAWRRIMHMGGSAVLLYYVIPDGFFVVVPKLDVLLAALLAVLVIEGLRRLFHLELPTIRPYEARRIGSYVFYSIALVGAVVLFPEPIGAAVVLGTAFVDPLAGELRASTAYRRLYPAVPLAAYVVLAFTGLAGIGHWPWPDAVGLAVIGALVGVAAERPKIVWVDDDLAMTFLPAIALYLVGVVALGLPG
jgi:hypothetical protein